MDSTDEELDALVFKIEGNLPFRREQAGLTTRELYRLELTLRERNILGEALRRMPGTRS
jgi:hypothetical protein